MATSDIVSSTRSTVQQRVRRVARRAHLLVCLHGVSWFVATVCLVALCLGVSDYLIRFQDRGVRLICFALVWLVAAWAVVRYLVSAWRYRCSDLQAARCIERWFPGLGDLLSNAVAFSAQSASDPKAGSLELRAAVIARAEAAVEPLDLTASLDRRPALRAACVAAVVLTLLALLGAANGPATRLAAKRLLVPWGADHWPRRHVLRFVVAPTHVAAGQDFEVELVDDNGRLPDQVQIHYWHEGDADAGIETHAMQPLGQKLTHRLPGVTRGFRYRATGGDDQNMAWRELRVVQPARVLSQEIHLVPPAYTGLAARTATGSFRALQGTRVALHVRVSKRLAAAALDTDTTSGPQRIPLRLDGDRRGCTLSHQDDPGWEIRQTGGYGFHLVDADGVDSGTQERWEVEAIVDTPPTVTLKQPAADLFVTRHATIPLEAIVEDDLAIRSVTLQFTRDATAEDTHQVVPLWTGPDQVTPESDHVARGDDEGVQRTVQHAWDLATMPDLVPGSQIDFRVVAADYQPQESPSANRRITIISAEEHEERTVQRQAEILAQIAEVARLQQQTYEQTTQVAVPLRERAALSRDDIDQLQGAELNQRQVQQRLGHPSDGIQSQVADLLSDMQRNQLDSSAAMARLAQLRDGIRALNEQALPGIEHHLIDALKMARENIGARAETGTPDASRARQPLLQLVHEATAAQQEVIRTLEQMLGQLAQWDSYRRLATEVGRLRREQEDVRQRTESLRQETLSKDLQDLTDAQRITLRQLAEQQNDIALRFDMLQGRMHVTRQELSAADPQAAAILDEALTMVERAGVSGDMRNAARQMGANCLSQAAEEQGQAIQSLSQLQDILANRQEGTPDDERRQQLEQLLQAVAELIDRQQRLATETQQLEESRPAAGDAAPAGWDETLQRLTAEQVALGHDVGSLQNLVADIDSFMLTLQDVQRAAAQAAAMLQERDTGASTQAHQQDVLDALIRLREVLNEEPIPSPPDTPAPDSPPASTQEDRPADSRFLLVQLRLIRTLQQELGSRTALLDQAIKDNEGWSERRVAQQRELTDRQGRLADLLERLSDAQRGQDSTATEPLPDVPPHPPARPADTPDQTMDQRLLDGLPGAAAANPAPTPEDPAPRELAAGSDVTAGTPYEQIARRMRDVAQRLGLRDTSQHTQASQRQIVEALQQMIESLDQQQGRSQQQTQGEKKPDQDGGQKTGQDAARNSADSGQPDGAAEDTAATVQRAMGDVWGHLPERYRRHVQNAGAVEFLPQYRKLIEDYYRRLSEERTPGR